MRLHRACIGLIPLGALLANACGSSDKKKDVTTDGGLDAMTAADGQNGGGGGSPGMPDTGQPPNMPDTGQPPGMPDTGTDRSAPPMPEAGADVSADAASDVVATLDGGSDAATDAAGPRTKTLFSVAPGSVGLAATAVAAEAEPQSSVYGAGSPIPEPTSGDNSLEIAPADLGLAAGDDIDALSFLVADPATPLYRFSVTDHSGEEGAEATHVRRSSVAGDVPADLFFSDGSASFKDLGEGGSDLGYNALWGDELSLGLQGQSSPDAAAGPQDDVNALHVASPTDTGPVYFSVAPGATGTAATALRNTAANERGCTIYASDRDGNNRVALTCANLGLAAGDDVDALAVVGSASPDAVLFSVTPGSAGLASTGVATRVGSAKPFASDIYRSTGDGNNTLEVLAEDLGLQRFAPFDDLDALAVEELPSRRYEFANTCTLTPSPFDAPGDGGAGTLNPVAATPIALGILVTFAQGPGGVELRAYDVSSDCGQVGAAQLIPTGTVDYDTRVAIIPLPGWSAAAPFQNIEIWTADGFGPYSITHLDGNGAVISTYTLTVPNAMDSPSALAYDGYRDRFIFAAPAASYPTDDLLYFDRPAAGAADAGPLPITGTAATSLPQPCASSPFGTPLAVAALGDENLIVANPAQSNGGAFRVCELSPTMQFRGPAVPWTEPPTGGATVLAASFPGNGVVVVHHDGTDVFVDSTAGPP